MTVHAPTWFFEQGIQVFPVHPKSKIPAVKSWDDHVGTLADAKRLVDYAVPLGVLAVADSDDAETEAWAAEHLPPTPFVVYTARGIHRYYRLVKPDSTPHFFYRNGLTMEFRHRGQYVIGPGSTHKSGVVYTAADWSWQLKDVPFFDVEAFLWDDRPIGERGSAVGGGDAYQLPDKIYAGERHDQMFRIMRSLRMRGVPLEGAITATLIENQHHCEPPLPEMSVRRFLTRTFRHADRAGYMPRPVLPSVLVSDLQEAGFSIAACIAAAEASAAHHKVPVDITEWPAVTAQQLETGRDKHGHPPPLLYGPGWVLLDPQPTDWVLDANMEWTRVPAPRKAAPKKVGAR